jgi:phospholipid-binding lipoprotein MlaA
MKSFPKYITLITCLFFGCFNTSVYATTNDNQNEQIKDPYEKFNRIMFDFNDAIDECCLKPTAKLYKKIVPRPLKKGIHHIFQNLHGGSIILNDLLQANFYQATSDSWRFIINSTLGIGGFFDIASDIGLPHNQTNFGITLAKWGYKESNYIVLPFWGPSTIRDAIGLPVDYFTSIYPYVPVDQRNFAGSIEILDLRAQALRFEEVYETLAIDPYLFSRDAYLQHTDYLIKRSYELDNPYTQKKTEPVEKEPQDTYYLDE